MVETSSGSSTNFWQHAAGPSPPGREKQAKALVQLNHCLHIKAPKRMDGYFILLDMQSVHEADEKFCGKFKGPLCLLSSMGINQLPSLFEISVKFVSG